MAHNLAYKSTMSVVDDHLIAAVAKHSDSFIIISDENDHIIWVNDSLLQRTGFTLAEVYAKKPGEVFRGTETDRETGHALDEARKKGQRFSCELLNYTKSGEPFWVQVSMNPLADKQNRAKYFISISSEITHQKQIQQELLDAKQETEKLAKEKREIVSALSHDLKSPLSAISGILSLFETSNLNNQQKEYLELLRGSAQSMKSLVENILELGKIQENKLQSTVQEVDLNQFLDKLYHQFDILAKTSNNALHFEVDEQISRRFLLDPVKLTRVLSNLIGNAIKFTQNGTITVSVKPAQTAPEDAPQQAEQLLIAVADTGPGIPKEARKKIFSRFEQSDENIVHKYGGTGLGLSICKDIVEKMGGKIWLQSKVGKGTTFFVEITLKTAA